MDEVYDIWKEAFDNNNNNNNNNEGNECNLDNVDLEVLSNNNMITMENNRLPVIGTDARAKRSRLNLSNPEIVMDNYRRIYATKPDRIRRNQDLRCITDSLEDDISDQVSLLRTENRKKRRGRKRKMVRKRNYLSSRTNEKTTNINNITYYNINEDNDVVMSDT